MGRVETAEQRVVMALPSAGSEDGWGSMEGCRGVDGYVRECGGGHHKREVQNEQRG